MDDGPDLLSPALVFTDEYQSIVACGSPKVEEMERQ
jgi:hypothetical protein